MKLLRILLVSLMFILPVSAGLISNYTYHEDFGSVTNLIEVNVDYTKPSCRNFTSFVFSLTDSSDTVHTYDIFTNDMHATFIPFIQTEYVDIRLFGKKNNKCYSIMKKDFDYEFNNSVPEPSSIGLVVCGASGLLFVRRKLMI